MKIPGVPPDLGAKLKKALQEHKAAFIEEIHQTGDLSRLLVKWSTRGGLTPEEKQRVQHQLLDVLKTIPALAIFVAPLGVVMLPLVYAMLPKGMRPSAFQEMGKEEDAEPEED